MEIKFYQKITCNTQIILQEFYIVQDLAKELNLNSSNKDETSSENNKNTEKALIMKMELK